jgi:cysteine-rich repeat protein
MRTSILSAAIFGLFAAGCAGDLSGTGPGTGDDVQPPANCGNGQMDSGETCDDGNTMSGDGCSSLCTNENTTTPKLNISVDKPTVTTDLSTDTMLTVSLIGEGGFGGPVTLTGTATDAAGAALTGWTVTFAQPSVTVPENGMVTAVATVHVPALNVGLAANIKIEAASSLPTVDTTSAFTAMNQITYEVTNNVDKCAYPPTGVTQIKVGTKVRFVNKFAAGAVAGDRITIHMNVPTPTNNTGFAHEPDPGHAIDTAYERTAAGPGTVSWYCHAPGPTVNGITIQIVQ